MIGVNQAAHCTRSSPGISWLIIPVTVHFLGDVLDTLTSEPARPPLAPLNSRSMLSLVTLSNMIGYMGI